MYNLSKKCLKIADYPFKVYDSLGLGEHGQAWYVNGDLAPDLYLIKGVEYTFIVEVRGRSW